MKRSKAAKIWIDYHMTHSKKKGANLTRLPMDTMAIQPKFHVSTSPHCFYLYSGICN